MKTYSIADLVGKYKTQGRGSVENGVLMLNWSAASFEFTPTVAGFRFTLTGKSSRVKPATCKAPAQKM